jgi:NAD(P)H dehydrogenase (quinone)
VKVLVVYAHPDPDSFTHAILEHVTRGLADGGHDLTVNDLYANGFDPVFTQHDGTQFLHESLPDELLEQANLPEAVMRTAKDPVRRHLAKRWLRGKSPRDIARAIAERQPKDVQEQQQLVADAEGLVFVAPVFWMGFPAMLKGWFERVFAYGFAYTLTREGWQGDLNGRVPLLSQERALILTPTFFTEKEYDKGWRSAMDTVLCDWGLKMAGVQQARHHYFYAVLAADDQQRQAYLDDAYRLGRDF